MDKKVANTTQLKKLLELQFGNHITFNFSSNYLLLGTLFNREFLINADFSAPAPEINLSSDTNIVESLITFLQDIIGTEPLFKCNLQKESENSTVFVNWNHKKILSEMKKKRNLEDAEFRKLATADLNPETQIKWFKRMRVSEVNFVSTNDNENLQQIIPAALYPFLSQPQEKLNSISFEPNLEKSEYSLNEFEALQQSNKVHELKYSQQTSKPKLYIIDYSLYVKLKNPQNEISLRKVTDLEFVETYIGNYNDFYVYFKTNSNEKRPFGIITNEMTVNDISILTEQLQNIKTLKIKINSPNPEIIPAIQFRQQYEMKGQTEVKVFKAPESNRAVSFQKLFYNDYRIRLIKKGVEQPYSENYNPIFKFDSENGADFYILNENHKSDIDYIRKIDKVELKKDNFNTTIAFHLKSLSTDKEPNIVEKRIENGYHLHNFLQLLKQENFTLTNAEKTNKDVETNLNLEPELQNYKGRIPTSNFEHAQETDFDIKKKKPENIESQSITLKSDNKSSTPKYFDPQKMPFNAEEKTNKNAKPTARNKQVSANPQFFDPQNMPFNAQKTTNEPSYFDPQKMPFDAQETTNKNAKPTAKNKRVSANPQFFDPQKMPFNSQKATNEPSYFDPQKMPFNAPKSSQTESPKAKFNLKSNKEPAGFHFYTFNRLINNGKITPINISKNNQIKDLTESLKSEADSLVLYQKNSGLYFRQTQNDDPKSNFANKIKSIEIAGKNDDNSNKVLLNFDLEESGKSEFAEIHCTDDELSALFNFVEKQNLLDAEEFSSFPVFYGNMFYHSGTTPNSDNNEAFFEEVDDATLFTAPFPDNTRYNEVQKSDKVKSEDFLVEKNKPEENLTANKPQDTHGGSSVIINAGPAGTVNFYPPFSARKSDNEGGESTVSNTSGFNYSVIPDSVPMHNVTTYDMEQGGYSVADTGNISSSTPTAPTAPTAPPAPTAPETPASPPSEESVESENQGNETLEMDSPYDKKPGDSPERKPQKPEKKSKPKGRGPSGFELFVTELLPIAAIIMIGFLMLGGAGMALPMASGLVVLSGMMFFFKQETMLGAKSVFGFPHKHMKRTFKNYAVHRQVAKQRKLEAEMNLQRQYKSGKETMDNLLNEDAEAISRKNNKLQKLFLTDQEKQDERLSDENKHILSTIRYYDYMDKNHPLKLKDDKPKEKPNFNDTVIPGRIGPKTQRTFSSDPDLNPDSIKDNGKPPVAKSSTIDNAGIHSGQGSLQSAEKPYKPNGKKPYQKPNGKKPYQKPNEEKPAKKSDNIAETSGTQQTQASQNVDSQQPVNAPKNKKSDDNKRTPDIIEASDIKKEQDNKPVDDINKKDTNQVLPTEETGSSKKVDKNANTGKPEKPEKSEKPDKSDKELGS